MVRDREQYGRLRAWIWRDPNVCVRRRVREASVEDDELRAFGLRVHHALRVRVEVVARFEVRTDEEYDARVGVVGRGAVESHPELIARARRRRADVGVRVVAVNAPRRENPFRESVLARSAHVIHHLVVPPLSDGLAYARGDVFKRLVPTRLHPLALASFARAFEREEYAVGVCYLVECGRALRAVAPARAWVFGIALELLHGQGLSVHVRQKPARRLAVKARRRHKHVTPLTPLRPRARVQLHPVVPALLRRERGRVYAARPRIESLAARLRLLACRAHALVQLTQIPSYPKPARLPTH